jgi:hypothetical protein
VGFWLGSRKELYAQGYADDMVFLITGKFPSIVSEFLQRVPSVVETWPEAEGISVNLTRLYHCYSTR